MAGRTRKTDHEHCSCVPSLEADLRDLKRRLAHQNTDEQVVATGKRGKRGENDWLDELPNQDRDWFKHKLGLK